MSQDKQMVSYEKILKDVAKKGAGVHSLAKTYPAYLILIVLLALSFLVRDFVTKQIENDLENEFNKSTSNIIARIENLNARSLEVLYSMSGLYDLIIDVVRDYFELYATIPTRTYSSISGVSYISYVKKPELDNFIFYARSQGYYDFKIQNLSPSGEHYIINHSIPYSRNIHRIGLDLASDPNMLKAIEQARDNDKVTSTPFYFIRPDTLGIYFLAPVYKFGATNDDLMSRRANFIGVVTVELNALKFFESAFLSEFLVGSRPAPIDTSVIFAIFDKSDDTSLTTIYESANYKMINSGFTPKVTEEQTVYIGDREIIVKFFAHPNFGGQLSATLPNASLIISLLISFAFFGFVYSVVTSRSRALDLADRMTRSQRRIVESSKDIIAVLNDNKIWISMNPASYDILGLEEVGVIGTSFETYVFDDENKHEVTKIFNKSYDEEVTERIYLKMRHASGDLRWVYWSFTISPKDKLFYCIGRDVTTEKLAEEQTILQQKQLKLAELFAREAIESKNYFMKKMSHQLRNSLTGILGYLQMVSQKIYENQEEHDSYIKMAEESSEEIFTFVSDMIDATVQTKQNSNLYEFIKFGQAFDEAKSLFLLDPEVNHNVEFELDENSRTIQLFVNHETLTQGLFAAFDVLTSGEYYTKIQIYAQENHFEKVTEIQILCSQNDLVSKFIDYYRQNSNHIIESLKHDRYDIMLKIAKTNSYFNIMGANLTVDTLGQEGNLITFHIPFNRV